MSNASAIAVAPPVRRVGTSLSSTGRIVIVMLLVLVFEGAIRKWLVPSATGPLILLRDLLALYVIFNAVKKGSMRRSHRLSMGLLLWSCCVIGWGLLQLTLGESNAKVFLIGLRFWLLYFWFAVAAASLMTERDYIVAVRVLLISLVVTTPLVVLQHYSPPTSILNLTPDTDPEDIFIVIQGVVRTTGTFTFTAGYVFFLSMCAPFVLGAIEARKRALRHLVYALMLFGCLAASAMVSGARTAVIFTGAMLAVYFLGNLIFAPGKKKGRAIISIVIVALAVAGMVYVFSDAVTATQERFADASQSEDFGDRLMMTFFGEPWVSERADIVGAGLGLGSNLAQFVQVGERTVFTLAESEPGRTLLEGGLVGWLFIILKFATVAVGMITGLALAIRTRTVFPILLWSAVSVALVTWPVIGQITANGLFGLLLLFGLLSVRYPRLQIFG